MDNGHIKIDPKIFDCKWYKDRNLKILFLHLLLKANSTDISFMNLELKKGTFISSFKKVSEETGLSIKELKDSLLNLSKIGEIDIDFENKYTVFHILNYGLYHVSENKPKTTKVKERVTAENNNYTEIVNTYNAICKSFKKVEKISEARKKALAARIRQGYSMQDFIKLFTMAENSNFLKGSNDRNWSADFDWLIKDTNIVKVLEGKYNKNIIPFTNPPKQNEVEKTVNRFDCIPTDERKILIGKKIIDIKSESMNLANADEHDLSVLRRYRLVGR